MPRFLWRLAAVLLAFTLSACAPGTGGTGTGPSVVFSTASSSLSDVGTDLPSVPAGGTSGCPLICGRVDLLLLAESVEAVTVCGRFVSPGALQYDATGLAVLPGTLQSAAGSVPATLRLQFSDTPAGVRIVTLTLSGADGKVLLGPISLGLIDGVPPGAPSSSCAS